MNPRHLRALYLCLYCINLALAAIDFSQGGLGWAAYLGGNGLLAMTWGWWDEDMMEYDEI